MKRNIKLSVILSLGLILAGFNAHAVWNTNSIGDDGNPHTEGNAGAKEHHAKLKSTTKLVLRNDTNSLISSIQIKDPDGKVHYSNNHLDCAIESFCEISAPGLKLSKDLDAFFFDKKNKLISVYDFSSVPDSSQYEYIYAGNLSLGLYIYGLLEHIDKQMSFDGLSHAFGENSDKYSPFELLGGYYQQQIDAGKSSNQVLNSIDNVIKNNGKLPVNSALLKSSHLFLSPNQTRMVGSSATKSPFCSNGMKTTIGIFEALAKGPFAILAPISKFVTAVQYSACPSASTNYAQQFNEINFRLSQLRDQMNDIANSIGALSDQVSLNQVTHIIGLMDRDTINMETALNQYYSFLQNQPDQNGRRHTSLQSYIAASGGIDKVMNTPVWNRLSSIYAGSNQLRTSITNLNTEQRNLRRELNSYCRVNNQNTNVDSIVGSIVGRRIDCNYYILRSYVRYASIAAASQQALQDMLNSIAGANGFINFQYQNNQASLNSDFNTFLQNMEDNFGTNQSFIIPLTQGLNPQLASRIQAVGCVYQHRDSNGRNVNEPYITDWHGGANPYVEVMCPGDQRNTMFKSRYQYRDGNTNYFNPRNVMGVLVPNDFFTSNNQRIFNQSSELTHGSFSYNNIRSGIVYTRFIAPINSQIYSTNLSNVSQITEQHIVPSQFRRVVTRDNRTFSIMANNSHVLRGFNVYENNAITWDIGDLFIGNFISRSNFISFIRYTDASNVSRVWAFYPIFTINNQRNSITEVFQQQCMTLDCRASSSNPEVRFGDTRYSWTASPAGLLDSSYIMTINGEAIPVSR